MKLHCPRCSAAIAAADVNVATNIAKCAACDEVFDFRDQLGVAPIATAPPAPQPPSIKVFEDEEAVIDVGYREARRSDSKFMMTRRWFTPSVFFMVFFCVAWDGFLVFWYSIALRGQVWIMIVFPIVHVAVGVSLTYSTLCSLFNTTRISLEGGRLVVAHGPIPARGNRTIEAEMIERIATSSVSSKSDNQNVDVVLKSGDGVKLLSNISYDEARFIAERLDQRLARARLAA